VAAELSCGSELRMATVARKVVADDERKRARVAIVAGLSVDSEETRLNRAHEVENQKLVRKREKNDTMVMLYHSCSTYTFL